MGLSRFFFPHRHAGEPAAARTPGGLSPDAATAPQARWPEGA